MNVLLGWLRRTFADPQATMLVMLLLGGFVVLSLLGGVLAPVIASLVVAYLLEGPVGFLERRRFPRLAAVTVVFLVFLGVLLGLFLFLVPLLLTQVAQLAQQIPSIYVQAQELLLGLPDRYPELISRRQIADVADRLREEVVGYAQMLLVYSVAWLPTLVQLGIYLVLMPMLVFFFLKDKRRILSWFLGFLPPERPLVERVWREANVKVGGYVRGKVYEIAIVGAVSYLAFLVLGLDFSVLLAVATGLSVLIPYVGALLAAIPVVLAAYGQWGLAEGLIWAAVAYAVIQFLDGFVLAPLLLAETADLHPNAVIVAILVFGGVWGFWGLFFAVPLAALIQAVLSAWPRSRPA